MKTQIRIILVTLIVSIICPVRIIASYHSIEQRIAAIDSLWNIDSYDEAITLIHTTIPYVIKTYGQNSKYYNEFMIKCSQIYSDNDNDKQAMSIIDDVIRGLLHSNLSNDMLYAKALSKKALYYVNLGETAKAIPIFGEALNIFTANEPSLDYATCLKDLAIAYYDTGQYEKAKTIVSSSKQILPLIDCSDLDAEYVSIEICYNDIIAELGDTQTSIDESYRIINKLKQANKHIKLQSNLLLGLICSYLTIEDYKEAINACACTIQFNKEHNLDITNKDLGTIYFYQGMAYYSLSDFENARDNFLMALKYRERSYGYLHPYTIGTLRWLVDSYDRIEDIDNIIEYAKILFERCTSDFFEQFPKLDAKAQVIYWKEIYSNFFLNTLPDICKKYKHPIISELTYNGLLLAKGILLESDIRFKHALQCHYDQSFAERYNTIELQRNNHLTETENLDFAEQKLRLDFINSSNYLDIFKTSWKDVSSKLKSDEIAIEFLTTTLPSTKAKQFAALLVTNECNHPQYINLFSSDDLLRISDRKLYTTDLLSKLLWEPILNELNGIRTIYFSPISELYNISIENLPYPNGEIASFSATSYMSDKYTMVRLNSTRELIIRELSNFITSVVLFGDMNYDGKMEKDSVVTISSVSRGNDYRSGFMPLPGTKIEIANIDKTLSDTGIEITTYTENLSTKEEFVKLSGRSPSIIHIATHGYYIERDTCYNGSFFTPLDWSGLAFSGFNQFINSNTDSNEGSITASEISRLNLYNTDIAVLSACQSGLGKIEGDGVYGLQRGFKMAGVNSLLMSLWNVDDDATQLLMTEFYKNYTSGFSKLESLKRAQQKVRNFSGEINGVRRNFSKPRYWAAFILLDALN